MKRINALIMIMILLVFSWAKAEYQFSDLKKNPDDKVSIFANRFLEEGYDYIEPVANALFIVAKDELFGVVDQNGEFILPRQYQNIVSADECFVVETDDKFGLWDSDGRNLIAPVYDWMSYANGTAVVGECDSGEGVLDRDGSVLIPLIYSEASYYVGDWARVLIEDEETEKWNFINRNGETLLMEGAEGGYLWEDYILYVLDDNEYIMSQENGEIRQVDGNVSSYLGEKGLFLIESNGREMIYSFPDDIYLRTKDHEITGLFEEGRIAVRDKRSGKLGYADAGFQIIVDCIYDAVGSFSEGRAWAVKDGNWFLIDENGTCLYNADLEQASYFSEGVASIRTEEGWGFVNKDGEILLEPSLVPEEDFGLWFINGYCDLTPLDFSSHYINHDFELVIEYSNENGYGW